MVGIVCEDIHVRYPVLHVGRAQSLLGTVARTASFGQIGRSDHNDITHVHALRGVTVAFRDGERVGVIGRNGAGKSTFLKMLAGINWPSEGVRTVTGSVASVLSLHAGLDMEKSGAENIAFLMRLRGVPREARPAVYQDVAEFTQLGDYLSMPLRTYSAGMLVRRSIITGNNTGLYSGAGGALLSYGDNSLDANTTTDGAQRAMRRERRYSAPHAWAGWVLQGDWKPLSPGSG